MGDRDTGDERESCSQWETEIQEMEVELQAMGDRDTGDGR